MTTDPPVETPDDDFSVVRAPGQLSQGGTGEIVVFPGPRPAWPATPYVPEGADS